MINLFAPFFRTFGFVMGPWNPVASGGSMTMERPATAPPDLPEKVLKFETFVEEQLKPDLRFVLEARDKIYAEIAEFLALKNSISAIQVKSSSVEQQQ